MHHGAGPDEGHEARGVIGFTPRHLVALGVPWLDQIGIGGLEHPFAGACHRIGHNLVDQPGGFGLGGIVELAFQQERGCAHGAQLADKARGAAGAGKDADHDLGQADLGLGVIGGKDAMRGKRQFQPDPQRGAGQGARDGLAALLGLGVHPRQLDLAQQMMQGHHAVEDRRYTALFHAGDDVQVHAGGKVLFAAGDDDALDGLVSQRLVDEPVEHCRTVQRQHVHGFGGHVPGDDSDAVGAFLHGEIGHIPSSVRRAR